MPAAAPLDVLITLPLENVILDNLRAISPRINILHQSTRKPEDIPPETWRRAEVLYTDLCLPQLEQAPNLRWIQVNYAGVDHLITAPVMQKADLMVTTISGAAAPQVAEFAVMMMMAQGRRMLEIAANQSRKEWPRDRWERFSPVELNGATVGIIGYGSIGREIARLLHPFHCTILAVKRDGMHPRDPGYIPSGHGDPEGDLFTRLYPPEALRAMLKLCDFVAVCLPLTPGTRGMIAGPEFAVMKPSAYLVDVGRGGVVDHAALLTALQEKKLAGAALDVFAEEPLQPTSALWRLPNVILSPHIAGISPHYLERAAAVFTENLRRYINGTALLNLYHPELGY